MAKMKAEFQHQYYKSNGIPFRTKMIANFTQTIGLASNAPSIYNFFAKNKFTSKIVKQTLGFAPERSLPLLHKQTVRAWYNQHKKKENKTAGERGKVYLFCDEFTNLNDSDVGIKAILLLEKLGYEVELPTHYESGRTYLSKGLLTEAKDLATKNVQKLAKLVSDETPIIGIEPSAILTLKDEYLDLVDSHLKPDAEYLGRHTYCFDEFIAKEMDKGKINGGVFTDRAQVIKLHGHCHQKALSSLTPTKRMLELPKNYKVHLIRSGCCGMAGSFGYEKEHYETSMKVGELVLFPAVRKQPETVEIAAPGTSCRHQIMDGTGRKAKHPVEILWEALGK